MLKSIAIFCLFFLSFVGIVHAQTDNKKVLQFSGKVVTEDQGELIPLSYTNIAILGTSRGSYTGIDGFFSLVAQTGDTIIFSRLGYKDVEYVIPDSMNEQFYSWIQIMSQDEYLLPEAVILPWPDRDFLKIEFLALDVTDDLRSKAQENLAGDVLNELRHTIPADGGEAFQFQNKLFVQDYQYSGQYKPQNIFSPLAWKKFIDAWRRGDFKRKKKKE